QTQELDAAQTGALLQISGNVRELSGQTTLIATEINAVADETAPVIEPVVYDPPASAVEALFYNESLEGMLVTAVSPAIAIAPTTQYGEYALVAEKWGVSEVQRTELPATGYLVFVDDGSSAVHADQSTLPYAVTKGDVVTDLTGPLAFTYGAFKIEPVVTPTVVMGERPLPTLPEAAANQFTIATFNVENMFDDQLPNPADPPLPSAEEYAVKLTKVADAIVRMGAPTILGLQEVENIGVLQDLAAQDALAAYGYEAYLVEGEDSRGIDVGYLVRGDRVTVEGFANYPEPSGLTARPPLLITATVHLDTGDQRLYVLNNHFLSLSAGEEATEATRTAQAAWNVSLMEHIRTVDPEAQFVVLGDLNSFYQTPPLDTLEAAGLHHAYEFLPEEERPYTYIFEGGTQSLDHILLSEGLFARVTAVTTLPIDADYPLPEPGDLSARGVSDHDPLVVTLTFE
ncbi:MAG: endonuclease/exonuclease/phosphatase family protein, partial [Ardenticatenaceae bacterium]|nr:endonuclease/exonuclease/phosphatase family protein [Ardenticatenaceae bacterium]